MDNDFERKNSHELQKLDADDIISKNFQDENVGVIHNVNLMTQPEDNSLNTQKNITNKDSLKTLLPGSEDNINPTNEDISNDVNSKIISIQENASPLSSSNTDILEPDEHIKNTIQTRTENLPFEKTIATDIKSTINNEVIQVKKFYSSYYRQF